MRISWMTIVLCLAAVSPAAAQIYTWRDGDGHLVLSNKPRTSRDVPTYAVPGPSAIRTLAETAPRTPFDDLIEEHAATYGVAPDLVRAVIQAESAFDPQAVSPKGAMGLMQLMPATARELGVGNPFHPGDNIRGGVSYLAALLARFNQNVELALAAYNAGPTRVERYGAVPPFRETQAYVRKIAGKARTKAPAVSRPVIYKWVDVVDGKPTTRYSNVAPVHAEYTIVGQR